MSSFRLTSIVRNALTGQPVGRRPRRRPTQHLGCEGLEQRLLLAAEVALVDGVVTVTGTDNGEQITIDEFQTQTTKLKLASKTYVEPRELAVASPGQILDAVDVETFEKIRVTVADLNGHIELTREFDKAEVLRLYIDAHDGDDNVENNTSVRSTILGGLGNDRLVGGSNTDKIFGENGVDIIFGREGDDELYGDYSTSPSIGDGDFMHGGPGDDWMNGGGDDDRMLGGSGNDTMYGSGGADEMYGDTGNSSKVKFRENFSKLFSDPLFAADDGEDGNDEMHGGAGMDFVYGQGGNDEIWGGAHSDWLSGGEGADMLVSGDDSASDYLGGGYGIDDLYMGVNDFFDVDPTALVGPFPAIGPYSSAVISDGPDNPLEGMLHTSG